MDNSVNKVAPLIKDWDIDNIALSGRKWYAELMEGSRRFRDRMSPCQKNRCSACCEVTEIFLTEEDVERIAEYIADDVISGVRGPTVICSENPHGFLQIDTKENGHCIFLSDKGCSINDVKPVACRLFPVILELPRDTLPHFKLHPFCPYGQEFHYTLKDYAINLEVVDTIQRERRERRLGK